MSYPGTSVRHRPDLTAPPPPFLPPMSLRHVGLVDRLSLRVGTWLLVHGTAHLQASFDPAAHARQLRVVREREARERAAQRTWFLSAR